MASVWQERLGWIGQLKSVSAIARESQTPRPVIQQILRGGEVPSAYRQTLSNYYGRETYSRLRDAGATASIAGHFRGRALDTVRAAETSLLETVNRWAMGATRMKFAVAEPNMQDPEVRRYYDATVQSIQANLRESHATIDEFNNWALY